ncbi:MAG: cyclic nucleotide-binding domain-containing protein, partial [Gaiellaceae bacterium]
MSDARTIAGLALSRTPLFAGLTPAQLFEVEAAMRPRAFDARSELCRAGEVGDALFVILDGLAHVLVTDPRTGALETIARLRRGDVVGEMSLITGEPRVATVVAGLPTKVLELDREGFSAVIARHPPILGNLTRILSQRLAAAGTFEIESRRRGEAVALLVGPALEAVVPRVVAAAQAAAPREVAALDTRDSLQRALAQLDELLPAHHAVILVADLAGAGVALLADHVDRVVALVDDREADVLEALRRSSGAKLRHLELVLAVEGPGGPGGLVDRSAAARIATRKADGGPDALATGDVAWLSRHLTRTKLGLALGAGGAKGYAHIGVLHV